MVAGGGAAATAAAAAADTGCNQQPVCTLVKADRLLLINVGLLKSSCNSTAHSIQLCEFTYNYSDRKSHTEHSVACTATDLVVVIGHRMDLFLLSAIGRHRRCHQHRVQHRSIVNSVCRF